MALKLPGVLGKILSIVGKVYLILQKGHEIGLYNQTAGPNVVTNKNQIRPLLATLDTEGKVALVGLPVYDPRQSLAKGAKRFLQYSAYVFLGGLAAWFNDSAAVSAFLSHVGVSTMLLPVIMSAFAGIGSALLNLDKNFDPDIHLPSDKAGE